MPGYIMHLASAKLAIDKLGFSDFNKIFEICVGSVLADTMAREDKKESHFWSDESIKLLKRAPETAVFEEKYRAHMKNPFVAAYWAHLYMDRTFVNDYWTKHFEFFNDDMKPEERYDEVTRVRLIDTGLVLSRSDFLSDEYYYGDYTRLLSYITYRYKLKDLFEKRSMEDIALDIESFDNSVIEEIKENAWKDKILKMFESVYGSEPSPEQPRLKVFDLKQLEKLILSTADAYCEKFTEL
jgi:hypothetical protein